MTKTELHFSDFPYYLSFFKIVELNEFAFEGGTVKVEIHSRVHKNKRTVMPNSWTVEMVNERPKEFINDVRKYAIRMYGLKKEPVKYS